MLSCRYGNCVPYRLQAPIFCDQFYTPGVDFVYVPHIRRNGDYYKLHQVLVEGSKVIQNTIEGCDTHLLKFICNYLFPSCGNVTTVSPPTLICENVCEYMMKKCADQWNEAVNFLTLIGSHVSEVGGILVNCSYTAEYVEPLSHCCSDIGIQIRTGIQHNV